MEKYRIISETDNNETSSPLFYIERKRWFIWKKITTNEGVNSSNKSFNSYDEAEAYMKKQYFGHGSYYKPYPNEYHYESYYYGF